MAQQNIDVGNQANTLAADSVREAFQKCNHNFDELYVIALGYVTLLQLNSYFDDPTTEPGWNLSAWQMALGIVPGTVALSYVDPPANFTDFSTLPGGVAPLAGGYIAMDDNYIWSIKGGETSWQQSTRSN